MIPRLRMALLLIGSLAALLTPASVPAQGDAPTTATATVPATPEPGGEGTVFVIPVEGEFEKALHLIIVRALREAREQNADAIVLDINSPGGRIDAAIMIRDELISTDVPTYAYVNPMAGSAAAFISFATDTIVMGPNSSIGAALPITLGAEGAQPVDRKFISFFAAEMKKTAKTKGHDPDIALSFCDPDFEKPEIGKEKGDVLMLDYDQATSYGLSPYQAQSIEDMLGRENLGAASIVRFHETPADRMARFLSSSAVVGVLMLIGLGGIFVEIKSPGFGAPGIIGITALCLFFFGSYLANLSGYLEWVLFAIGVILVIVEIYVIPGFGVCGISGITLIVGTLFFALVNLIPADGLQWSAPRLEMAGDAAWVMVGTLIGMIPAIWLLSLVLPATPMWRGMVLKPAGAGNPSGGDGKKSAESERGIKTGAPGEALTYLRPSGVARIEGRRFDVLTEGEFLEKGTAIEVVRIEGTRIFVQERKVD